MITQQHLENINLQNPPRGQMLLANTFLRLDYRFPRKTRIIIENAERIPHGQAVIFALNHTDSYNYWPFMYQLYRGRNIFISPLVKGKYYENFLLGKFFDLTNNIPLPSRGYVLTKDFQAAMKRVPNSKEYRLLRDLVDGNITQNEALAQAGASLTEFITSPRPGFDTQRNPYPLFIEDRYYAMMRQVTNICEDALLNKNINLLIFPQGTRSVRLLPGYIGLAQIALKTKAPVIPVGSNGCEKCYRGLLPFSAGGEIVYRVGQPLTLEGGLAPFAVNETFQPFTRPAERKFAPQFRGATDLIMERINDLLDPKYQFAANAKAITGSGVKRFV